MADINALIAQGGNVLGKFGQAADIRSANTRNELLQLGIQNEPTRQARLQAQEERAATTFEQEQMQAVRGQLFQGANDYVNAIESGNREAALAAIASLPDEGQLGEIKNNALVALNSPDPEDDVAVLEQARAIRQSGIDEGFFKGEQVEKQKAPIKLTEINAAGETEEFLADPFTGAEVPNTRRVTKPSAAGEGENLRRQKINDALRLNPSLSEQQATKVVDGQAKIEINEKTGNLVFTDLITQEVREIPFTTQEPATPTPPTGQSLFDLAGTATGPIQSIAGKVERTRAFLGGEAGEVTEAQQRYKTEIQNMVRALSINPRFPVGEIDRIREEIDIQPSFFQGEEVLKSKLRSIDSSLRVRLAQAEADANNPNLDTETRQNQGSNASSIRNFLTIMGVPQQAEGELESRKQELLNRLEQLRAQ